MKTNSIEITVTGLTKPWRGSIKSCPSDPSTQHKASVLVTTHINTLNWFMALLDLRKLRKTSQLDAMQELTEKEYTEMNNPEEEVDATGRDAFMTKQAIHKQMLQQHKNKINQDFEAGYLSNSIVEIVRNSNSTASELKQALANIKALIELREGSE